MSKIISKIALAVIQDHKILMARSQKNRTVFYTLGGKIEENETDVECLEREIKEEVNTNVDVESLKFLGSFSAAAHDKVDTIINVKLYLGNLTGEPVPSSEVEEIAFLDTTTDKKHFSELTVSIFEFLKAQNYIK
jgi:ADP-ribose pyrophosphatase YjhB (NUDIX family)